MRFPALLSWLLCGKRLGSMLQCAEFTGVSGELQDFGTGGMGGDGRAVSKDDFVDFEFVV